jgi:hypothetical protein
MMHATHVSNLQVAESSPAKGSATPIVRRHDGGLRTDGSVLMVDDTASACSGNPEKIRSASEIS